MKCSTCSINFERTGDNVKTDAWSGIPIEFENDIFCLTAFSPLVDLLPCGFLKNLSEQNRGILPENLLSFDVNVLRDDDDADKPKIMFRRLVGSDTSYIWKSSNLHAVMKNLVDPTTVESEPCCDLHNPLQFHSWFLFIKIGSNIPGHQYNFMKFSQLATSKITIVKKGMVIFSSAYPFGRSHLSVFGACLSKGVISNFLKRSLIITDARCLPGSEGGAIYSPHGLLGVIVSPIALESGQQTGFTAACYIGEVVRSFVKSFGLNEHYLSSQYTSALGATMNSFSKAAGVKESDFGPQIVKINTASSWGSGVVAGLKFDKNICRVFIVTCQHVIKDGAANGKVTCSFFSDKDQEISLQGRVCYQARSMWFDFAIITVDCKVAIGSRLLDLSRPVMKELNTSCFVLLFPTSYHRGDEVFVKAHTLFDDFQPPFLSSGVISKVVQITKLRASPVNTPILIHTTSIVLNGSSGGALFSKQNLEFLGLVVCNVQEVLEDVSTPLLYSNVSFVLPAALFMPAVYSLMVDHKHWSVKLDLLSQDNVAASHWALGPVSTFNSKL